MGKATYRHVTTFQARRGVKRDPSTYLLARFDRFSLGFNAVTQVRYVPGERLVVLGVFATIRRSMIFPSTRRPLCETPSGAAEACRLTALSGSRFVDRSMHLAQLGRSNFRFGSCLFPILTNIYRHSF